MKLARIMVSGLAMVSLTACSAVIVEEPIGTEIARIEADDWEGTWIDPDGQPFTINVADADAGTLWISSIDDGEGEPTVESRTIYVRKAPHLASRTVLLSVRDDQGYAWGLAVHDGDHVVLYAPDVDQFQALVAEGTLPGTVTKGGDWAATTVSLSPLEATHLEAIFDRRDGNLFVWQEPYVLRRVAR